MRYHRTEYWTAWTKQIFLTGKSEKSARESVIIYIGNELFGVKWRNWKMLLKEINEDSYAIQTMAYPSIYNLIVDPKEEEPEKFYLDDTLGRHATMASRRRAHCLY